METKIAAPIETVWDAWNNPDDIVQWNAASDDWHTTRASNDLRVGGQLNSRMEAKDGSVGFDFIGTYTAIELYKLIEYSLSEDRAVRIEFHPEPGAVVVRETFDAENEYPPEYQQAGWQAILDRFGRHVEAKSTA
ncbi:MAG: SRPBCC family protein [Planctomycetales bacterium]|nr:SRPBCC family protein [Planctomycetales bacterium]